MHEREAELTMPPPRRMGEREFIAMSACMMSVFAVSMDCFLPGMTVMGRDLAVANANDIQYVVTALVLGGGIGQILYGPVSDSIGRKPTVYLSLGIFVLGSVVCIAAPNLTVLLAGRVIQGIGAAGPRIVTVAIIRDQYAGRDMARIMSFALAVFVVMPILAPFMGQGVLLLATWRVLFGIVLIMSVVLLIWFAVRQPETLAATRKRRFSVGPVMDAVWETMSTRITLGCTFAAGCATGGMFAYVMTAPQILQGMYGVGAQFPLYFAAVGAAFGAAALLNGRLVNRYGMRRLCDLTLVLQVLCAAGFAVIVWRYGGQPPLWSLMIFLSLMFGAVGFLFGNFNALAMEPLGHIAGSAAGVVGSFNWFLGMLTGGFVGQLYNGSVLPLAISYVIFGAAALAVMRWAR